MSLLAARDGLLDPGLKHGSLIALELSELSFEVKKRVASGVGGDEVLLKTTSVALGCDLRILRSRQL